MYCVHRFLFSLVFAYVDYLQRSVPRITSLRDTIIGYYDVKDLWVGKRMRVSYFLAM